VTSLNPPPPSPSPSEPAEIDRATIEALAAHFGLGSVRRLGRVTRGSTAHATIVLDTDRGQFFLKKRSGRAAEAPRCAEVHRLHRHLLRAGFPVPRLVRQPDSGRSIAQCGERVYELTHFVFGQPFNQTAPASRAAGQMLARFHLHVASLQPPHTEAHLAATFHDVRAPLEAVADRIAACVCRDDPRAERARVEDRVRSLIRRYALAADRVNGEGFHHWPRMIVHGDWHPGNLVYEPEGSGILAVLDLDSMRFEPRVVDVANGALHFSMRSAGPDPRRWPDAPDAGRLAAFCDGYDHFTSSCVLSRPEVRTMPWLMLEALIVESLGPLASTGRFNGLPGRPFLDMVERKSRWLEHHAREIVHQLGD